MYNYNNFMPFFQDNKKLKDNSNVKPSTQAKHEKGTKVIKKRLST